MKNIDFFKGLFVIISIIFLIESYYLHKEINQAIKNLDQLELSISAVESQIKLLTPPPEFFQLPVVKQP